MIRIILFVLFLVAHGKAKFHETNRFDAHESDLAVKEPSGSVRPAQATLKFRRSLQQRNDKARRSVSECPLAPQEISEALNKTSRTWFIDDAALSAMSNDVNAFVNCTQDGDIVLFSTENQIRLPTPIVIAWNLTLSSAVQNLTFREGIFPTANRKSIFTCPQNDGIFRIGAKNLLLANLVFEDCSMQAEHRSIIDVADCVSGDAGGVIRLHHVTFRRNVLNGTSGLSVGRSSCHSVEMADVAFIDNACGDRCFASLSTKNTLQDVAVHRNTQLGERNQSLLHAPRGSDTSIVRMAAHQNELSVIRIVGGTSKLINSDFRGNSRYPALLFSEALTVNVADSFFIENSASISGAGILANGTKRIDVSNCTFLSNSATSGGAVAILGGTVSIIGCHFLHNIAARDAGSLLIKGGRLELKSSLFENNTAVEKGGAIFLEASNRSAISETRCHDNVAGDGGCLWSSASEEMVIEKSTLMNNSADNGGAIYCDRITRSRVMHTDIQQNSALSKGGGVFLYRSRKIDLISCTATNNTAEIGGGLACRALRHLKIHRCLFDSNSASKNGAGAWITEGSSMTSKDTTWSFNRAEIYGGGLYILESNITSRASNYSFSQGTRGGGLDIQLAKAAIFDGDTIVGNSAENSGAGISVGLTELTMRHCNIVRNSAYSASGVYIFNVTAVIENCGFEQNTAKHDGGGLMCLHGSLNLTDSHFVSNSAGLIAGAILIAYSEAVRAKNLTIRENVSAQSAAGIGVSHRSIVNISDSLLENNTADVYSGVTIRESTVTIVGCKIRGTNATVGAAIGVRDGEAFIDHSTMESNHAKEVGGAIFVYAGNATVSNSLFWNNKADQSGGCFWGAESSNITIRSCVFSDNRSVRGSSFFATSSTIVHIYNSTFENNTAKISGGGGYLDHSSVTVETSTFQRNHGKAGASLTFRNSTVRVFSSDFKDERASGFGGSIAALENSSVIFANASFTQCSAETGGAISLSESNLTVSDLQIRACNVAKHGGGVVANALSTFLCSKCHFANNTADQHGGAIAFESTEAQSLALQLNDCSFTGNKGTLGGAVHVSTRHESQSCSLSNTSCTFVAVTGSSFVDNNAQTSGGAIFLEDPDVLRYSCFFKETGTPPLPFNRVTFESLASLRSLQDTCPTWRENKAGDFGPIIASYARSIRVLGPDNATRLNQKTEGRHQFLFEDHRSGDPLPRMFAIVLDGFGQSLPYGRGDKYVEAMMESPDELFMGTVKTTLDQRQKELPIIYSLQQRGRYTVTITFSEPALLSIAFEVEIRDCKIGEFVQEDGKLCVPCSSTQYNFDTNASACVPCPLNANCTSSTIAPNKGYWHRTPCSRHLQECVSSDACEFPERDADLSAALKDIRSCQLNEAVDRAYSQAQCRKGYTDVLCGSCDVGYGRFRAFRCNKCRKDSETVVMFVASLIVLLLLSGFTIKSNLNTQVSCDHTDKCRNTNSNQIIRSMTQRTPSTDVPVNFQMVEMLHTGYVPPEIIHPELFPTATTNLNAENIDPIHAKTQIVEIFKIIVNFLQVIGTAVVINVKWTSWVQSMLSVADFMGGAATDGFALSIDCLFDADQRPPRSILRIVINFAVPLCMELFYIAFCMFETYRSNEDILYFAKTAMLSTLALVYLTYVSVTKTAVDTLHCIEAHDSVDLSDDHTSRYWALDTSLKCYEGSHAVLVGTIGVPVLIFFSFALPIALACALSKMRCSHCDDGLSWFSDASSFLYRAYKRSFVFWESVIMYRKAILTIIVGFAYPLGPNLQGIIAVCTLAIAIYIQLLCQPYKHNFNSLNSYEAASLVISCLTFASGLFFNDERTSDGVRLLLTVLISSGVCSFLSFLIYKLLSWAGVFVKASLVDEGIEEANQWGTYRSMKVYIFTNLAAFFTRLSKH